MFNGAPYTPKQTESQALFSGSRSGLGFRLNRCINTSVVGIADFTLFTLSVVQAFHIHPPSAETIDMIRCVNSHPIVLSAFLGSA